MNMGDSLLFGLAQLSLSSSPTSSHPSPSPTPSIFYSSNKLLVCHITPHTRIGPLNSSMKFAGTDINRWSNNSWLANDQIGQTTINWIDFDTKIKSEEKI